MTGTTLITGADGYVGRRVAAALLEAGDDHLVLAVRAGDTAEFAAKRAALQRTLPSAAADRISFAAADLRRRGALDQVDRRAVTRIVHAAAVTRFNVEWDVARRVNVEGTTRLAAFAATCPNLQRLALLSTLYSAGRRSGEVAERQHADAGFANHYEWSKWAAEQTVLSATDLPVSVLRLPTIIADGDDGQVTQHNAFHNTIKLYFYGLLSLVPGNPSTPVSLATAAFTTSAITRLLDPAVADGIYHICPDPADTPRSPFSSRTAPFADGSCSPRPTATRRASTTWSRPPAASAAGRSRSRWPRSPRSELSCTCPRRSATTRCGPPGRATGPRTRSPWRGPCASTLLPHAGAGSSPTRPSEKP